MGGERPSRERTGKTRKARGRAATGRVTEVCGAVTSAGVGEERSGRWARQARQSWLAGASIAAVALRTARAWLLGAEAGSGWSPKAAEAARHAATSIATRMPRRRRTFSIDTNILTANGRHACPIPAAPFRA